MKLLYSLLVACCFFLVWSQKAKSTIENRTVEDNILSVSRIQKRFASTFRTDLSVIALEQHEVIEKPDLFPDKLDGDLKQLYKMIKELTTKKN